MRLPLQSPSGVTVANLDTITNNVHTREVIVMVTCQEPHTRTHVCVRRSPRVQVVARRSCAGAACVCIAHRPRSCLNNNQQPRGKASERGSTQSAVGAHLAAVSSASPSFSPKRWPVCPWFCRACFCRGFSRKLESSARCIVTFQLEPPRPEEAAAATPPASRPPHKRTHSH